MKRLLLILARVWWPMMVSAVRDSGIALAFKPKRHNADQLHPAEREAVSHQQNRKAGVLAW